MAVLRPAEGNKRPWSSLGKGPLSAGHQRAGGELWETFWGVADGHSPINMRERGVSMLLATRRREVEVYLDRGQELYGVKKQGGGKRFGANYNLWFPAEPSTEYVISMERNYSRVKF